MYIYILYYFWYIYLLYYIWYIYNYIYIYIISDTYIYIYYLIYIYYIWYIYIYILYPIRIYIYYIWYIYIYEKFHIWTPEYSFPNYKRPRTRFGPGRRRTGAWISRSFTQGDCLVTMGDHGWSWGCGSKIIGKFL
jgi:hypothetical protein